MSGYLAFVYFATPNGPHVAVFDGMSEADMWKGLGFVLADAVAEALTFAAIVLYAKRALGLDVLRVGAFLVRRHAAFFALMPMSALVFVAAVWLRHCGFDTNLRFDWLTAGGGGAAAAAATNATL